MLPEDTGSIFFLFVYIVIKNFRVEFKKRHGLFIMCTFSYFIKPGEISYNYFLSRLSISTISSAALSSGIVNLKIEPLAGLGSYHICPPSNSM